MKCRKLPTGEGGTLVGLEKVKMRMNLSSWRLGRVWRVC